MTILAGPNIIDLCLTDDMIVRILDARWEKLMRDQISWSLEREKPYLCKEPYLCSEKENLVFVVCDEGAAELVNEFARYDE